MVFGDRTSERVRGRGMAVCDHFFTQIFSVKLFIPMLNIILRCKVQKYYMNGFPPTWKEASDGGNKFPQTKDIIYSPESF